MTLREFAELVREMRRAQRLAHPSQALPDPAPDAEKTARLWEHRVDLAVADALDGRRQPTLFDPEEG